MTYKDYSTWHDQEVLFPGLRYNDWVMLTPPELNGITGRIVMENPDRESEMNDIGVWDEIGVPVPEDRRSLKVLLRAPDSSRRKDLRIKLEAGKRFPLAW